ncbi:FUSC family protein, partial [Gemella palaticanis]|nr:FUSC family protein [Gemella palaticanis]NYS48291.1 FUSC family protein [Gemella palaticanis]
PTFSMTRQRRADRIIGTIIGCVVTAIVIRFVHSNIVLMAILFLSIVATPTFIYLRYRYTAIAVSLMILLQMHLVAPSNPNLVSERLIDTLIGAAVATVFSFVLANWEYQSLPRLVRQVLNVNLSYM